MYALTAQNTHSILGCIKTGVASRVREGTVPFCSAFMRPHLQYCVWVWGSQHRDMELLEHIQRRATKTIRGLQHPSYGERWRELGLFSLEKQGNGFKLKQRRFRLEVRNKFFTQRAVRPWHCCPEKLWVPHPWRHIRPGCMGPWAA